MSKSQRDKGKTGEREAAAELKRLFDCEAKRGFQFRGGQEDADVVTDMDGVHFEVKRTERFRMYDAMEQAATDSTAGALPVVLHRQNKRPWVAVVRLDDLPAVVKSLGEYLRAKEADYEIATGVLPS